jgi:hypothetical protein
MKRSLRPVSGWPAIGTSRPALDWVRSVLKQKGAQDAKDDLYGRSCWRRCDGFDRRFLRSGRRQRRRGGGKLGGRWSWKLDRRLVHNWHGHHQYRKRYGQQRGRSERWRQQPLESLRQQPYAQLAEWDWDCHAEIGHWSIGCCFSGAMASGPHEENASTRKWISSVLIRSEPKIAGNASR